MQQLACVGLTNNKLLSIGQRLISSVCCVNGIAVGRINIPVRVTRQRLAVFVNAIAIDVLDSVDNILGGFVSNNLNALIGPLRAIEHRKSGGDVGLSDRQNKSALLIRLNEALGCSGSGFSRARKRLGDGGLRRNRSRHSGAIGSNGGSNAVQRVKIRLQSHLIRASVKRLVTAEARQREGDFLRCLQLAVGNLGQRVVVRLAQLHFLGAEANVASVGIRNSGQRATGGFSSNFACRHLERTVVVAAVNVQTNEDVGLIVVVSNHVVGVVYHGIAVHDIVATRQSRPDDGQLAVCFLSSNQLIKIGDLGNADRVQNIISNASCTNGVTVAVGQSFRRRNRVDGVNRPLSRSAYARSGRQTAQRQSQLSSIPSILRAAKQGQILIHVQLLFAQLKRKLTYIRHSSLGAHGFHLRSSKIAIRVLARVLFCTQEHTVVCLALHAERQEDALIGHVDNRINGRKHAVFILIGLKNFHVDRVMTLGQTLDNTHLRGVHDNGRARAIAAACSQVVVATFGQGHRCLAFSVGHNAFKLGHCARRCIHGSQLDALQSSGGRLHGSSILVQVAVHSGNACHRHVKRCTSKSLSRGFNVGVLVGIRVRLIRVELNEVTAVDLRGGNHSAVVATKRRFGAIIRGRMVHEKAIGSIGAEVRLHKTGVRPIQHGLGGFGGECLFAKHIDGGSNHNVSCGNALGRNDGVRVAIRFCQVARYFLVRSGSSQVSASRLCGVAHGCRCGGLGGNSSARNGERHVVPVQRDGRVNPSGIGLLEGNCFGERAVVGLKTAAVAVNDRQGERAVSGFDDAFGCQRSSFSSSHVGGGCIGGDDGRLGVAVSLRTTNGVQRCSSHCRSFARHGSSQRSLTFVVARPQRFRIGIQLEHAGIYALPERLRTCLVSGVVARAQSSNGVGVFACFNRNNELILAGFIRGVVDQLAFDVGLGSNALIERAHEQVAVAGATQSEAQVHFVARGLDGRRNNLEHARGVRDVLGRDLGHNGLRRSRRLIDGAGDREYDFSAHRGRMSRQVLRAVQVNRHVLEGGVAALRCGVLNLLAAHVDVVVGLAFNRYRAGSLAANNGNVGDAPRTLTLRSGLTLAVLGRQRRGGGFGVRVVCKRGAVVAVGDCLHCPLGALQSAAIGLAAAINIVSVQGLLIGFTKRVEGINRSLNLAVVGALFRCRDLRSRRQRRDESLHCSDIAVAQRCNAAFGFSGRLRKCNGRRHAECKRNRKNSSRYLSSRAILSEELLLHFHPFFFLALSATSLFPKRKTVMDPFPSRPVFPWRNPPLTCGFAPCLVGLLTCAFESVQAYAHACLPSRRALRLPRLPQWPAFAFEVPGSALTAAGAVQEFHLIPLSIFTGTRWARRFGRPASANRAD